MIQKRENITKLMHHVKQGVAIYTLHPKVPFIILFFGSLDGIMGTRISHIVTILLLEYVNNVALYFMPGKDCS